MDSDVELVARALYEGFVFDGVGVKPPWTPGGNSLKQDEARRGAHRILTDLRSAGWQKVGPDQLVVPIEPAYIQCQACGAITVNNGDS
jgi:hypothetical protein